MKMKMTSIKNMAVYADIVNTSNALKKKKKTMDFNYNKELDNILLSYSFDDIDVLKQEDYNNELLFKNDYNVK